jgi:two-component system cell cycle response regulator DivK
MARVLIVEDDAASMDLALRIVRLARHEPITTMDGETAFAVALATHPRLILLDLHIPRLDGFAFARALRTEAWSKEMHIVAVSASATPPDRERALAAGCDAFLAKPYYPEQLRAVIEQYLPALATRTEQGR